MKIMVWLSKSTLAVDGDELPMTTDDFFCVLLKTAGSPLNLHGLPGYSALPAHTAVARGKRLPFHSALTALSWWQGKENPMDCRVVLLLVTNST